MQEICKDADVLKKAHSSSLHKQRCLLAQRQRQLDINHRKFARDLRKKGDRLICTSVVLWHVTRSMPQQLQVVMVETLLTVTLALVS